MPEMRIIEGFLGTGAILRSNRKEDLMAQEKPGGEIFYTLKEATVLVERWRHN